MKFKKYVFCFVIATFTGLAYGFIANTVVPDLSHAAFIKLTLLGAFKDAILWLRQHPPEDVSFGDTVPPFPVNKQSISTNVTDPMKPETKQNLKTGGLLGLWLATSILVCQLVGCTALQTPKGQARLINASNFAAYAGTVETLKYLPSKRAGFERAVIDLKVLEAGPIDIYTLTEIIQRLDVKELRSTEAQIVITGVQLTLITELGATPLDQVQNLKPIVTAIREGIERGLK